MITFGTDITKMRHMSACRDPFEDAEENIRQGMSWGAAYTVVLEKWIGEAAVSLIERRFDEIWNEVKGHSTSDT